MFNFFRTHNCGELKLQNVGWLFCFHIAKFNLKEQNLNLGEMVKVFGWVAQKRLNKFLVIRDSYGQVQTKVSAEKFGVYKLLLKKITLESVVCVEGEVIDRGKDKNPNLPTGDIEVRNVLLCSNIY